mmetsp:Transcript_61545/g.169172  ORF Transcript_61545/g.169172 Transcript_61545/m.169172 type:complete len:383 (-) Transcript_61545:753-1901(-)
MLLAWSIAPPARQARAPPTACAPAVGVPSSPAAWAAVAPPSQQMPQPSQSPARAAQPPAPCSPPPSRTPWICWSRTACWTRGGSLWPPSVQTLPCPMQPLLRGLTLGAPGCCVGCSCCEDCLRCAHHPRSARDLACRRHTLAPRSCAPAGHEIELTERAHGATTGGQAVTSLPACNTRLGASRHRSHQAQEGHHLFHTRDTRYRSQSPRAAPSERAAAPRWRPSSRHQEPPPLNGRARGIAAAAPAEDGPLRLVVLCLRVSPEPLLQWQVRYPSAAPRPAVKLWRSTAVAALPRSLHRRRARREATLGRSTWQSPQPASPEVSRPSRLPSSPRPGLGPGPPLLPPTSAQAPRLPQTPWPLWRPALPASQRAQRASSRAHSSC